MDGKFEVGLPWVTDNLEMPYNRAAVAGQLACQKRKFLKVKQNFEKYKKVMMDDLNSGFSKMQMPYDLERTNLKFCITHHTTSQAKFHVVFYGAERFQGISLNDKLLQEPDLACDMHGVILRWRRHLIAVKADIRKMFYHIRVRESDAEATRFLFHPDGDLNKEPTDHKMRVHIFGSRSSPSVAGYVLQRCIKENEPGVEQHIVDNALRSFYIDDLLTGAGSADEALNMVRTISDLIASGGFHLTKFVSNSLEVLKHIPVCD